MKFKRNKRDEAPPDITPMIDVVFLLLIFFMLSTTFIVQPGINISLPKSSAEEIKKQKEEVEISISREGDFYLGEDKVNLEALKEAFINAAEMSIESVVIINADEKASHGDVVAVMDIAKESGITKLVVATASKD
ncbi:MAG: biopolymer transporter ExbD [Proteobacteria bacterium]|nr:biopolymer transporter ExbD [Pseudomonadota bacterium]